MTTDQVLERLNKIQFWLSIIAKTQLTPILEAELSDSKTKKLYELTGEASAKELAKRLKCSMSTISEHWKRWERLGLVVKEGKRYRKVIE